MDCRTLRGEIISLERFDAEGEPLQGEPLEVTREDFSASVDHRRRVVCAATLAPRAATPPADLYRLFRPAAD